uniref:Uncharacterized protein n=1 Tax=Solanum tuberosum TaxID=4113 RepID=M1CIH7_SOLTU
MPLESIGLPLLAFRGLGLTGPILYFYRVQNSRRTGHTQYRGWELNLQILEAEKIS